MTLDKTMELAREAGCINEDWLEANAEFMQRFAALVAEREREACAKVCESIFTNGDSAEGWLYIAADKIRARGEKGGV